MMQLDLFRRQDDEILQEEFRKLKSSTENVRKGIFSRYNSLEKIVIELEKKLDAQAKEIEELKSQLHYNHLFDELCISR